MSGYQLDREARKAIFHQILPYLGKAVSAAFIQKTGEAIPGILRLHNLIEGIYKPVGAKYALSIASMLKNPYADRIEHYPDGSWFFFYSPKGGSLESAVNASLFACMQDAEDQYEVLIHPLAKQSDVQNFPLFTMDRKQICLPREDYYRPHPDALQWHRDEVYGQFAV